MDNEEGKAFGKALSRAMFYCSRAEHCPADVFEKLGQWQVPNEFWEEIINILSEEKFLSVERYTIAFVFDKLRYNKWGKQKIAFHLKAKQINRSIIDNVLSSIDNFEYTEIIRSELTKKCSTTKEADSYKMKAKLINFAMSRGFDIDLCNPIIEHLLTNK